VTCLAASGGVAGLMGAWTIGPRLGRFNGPEVKPIVGHNVESIALGTFLLWLGWRAARPARLAARRHDAVKGASCEINPGRCALGLQDPRLSAPRRAPSGGATLRLVLGASLSVLRTGRLPPPSTMQAAPAG